MNREVQHFVTVKNKKHSYILKNIRKKVTFVECKAAKIGQDFLNEDIPALIVDLPNLIIAEQDYQKKKEDIIRFRLSIEEKKIIETKALKNGYRTISSFLRDLALGKI